MAHEVAGIPLSTFEDPIYYALREYSDLTDGKVLFGQTNTATKLELTPDKPNSARSTASVFHEHEEVGSLYVIAFAPNDATGDDNTFTSADFASNQFPDDPKYFPRSKSSAHAETHLTIASQVIDSPQDSPVLFAGHLSLLGLHDTHLVEIGYVGQESHSFASTMRNRRQVRPRATLTTGYRGEMKNPDSPGERFGDPHAILNGSQRAVQVAGFIAISPTAAPRHLDALRALKANEPYIGAF